MERIIIIIPAKLVFEIIFSFLRYSMDEYTHFPKNQTCQGREYLANYEKNRILPRETGRPHLLFLMAMMMSGYE